MASIVIEDLTENTELDAEALTAVAGGYVSGFSWIQPFRRPGSFSSGGVNQFFTLNQFIADEIQIINQEQFVSINNSAGAAVDLNGDARNGLGKTLSLPGLV
jgi:hypothetical protein